jgi:FkbM family methyltransferase
MGFKVALRSAVNRLGYDIIRLHRSPQRTLLGVSRLDIRTIIDVGANRGQFAGRVSRIFPRAELYCFEPLVEPFGELAAWAQTQNGRVHCFQLALGDREGEAEMHLHVEHTPSSSLLPSTATNHRVFPQTRAERVTRIQISTLDRALEERFDSMPREILLKLDVQGFEDRVLSGGSRALSLCRAVVLEASLDPLYDGQADFLGLAQTLQDVGFRYGGNLDQYYDENGRVIFLDAMFVK